MDHDRGNGRPRDAARESGTAAEESDAPPASGGGVGDDPGAPGGMGGVRGGAPNPDNRPNGGVSPIQQGGDERE
jgi:hypothetical protein